MKPIAPIPSAKIPRPEWSHIRPAILAHSEKEFCEKVERVRALGLVLHIDVMDGMFVPNTTWAVPERMDEILGALQFEVHLMVEHPQHAVEVWAHHGAARVFFHAEAVHHMAIPSHIDGCTIGVALNPETEAHTVFNFDVHDVLIMGIHPGKSGQAFLPEIREKIESLARHGQHIITIDGGVHPTNILDLRRAGADHFVMGSGLTETPIPVETYAHIRGLLDEIE